MLTHNRRCMLHAFSAYTPPRTAALRHSLVRPPAAPAPSRPKSGPPAAQQRSSLCVPAVPHALFRTRRPPCACLLLAPRSLPAHAAQRDAPAAVTRAVHLPCACSSRLSPCVHKCATPCRRREGVMPSLSQLAPLSPCVQRLCPRQSTAHTLLAVAHVF
jgi:hypothetical protein